MRSPGERTIMTTILIVDDDANSRTLIRDLLRLEGYDVREAASVAEAMEAARISGPDVIITELMTASIDGIELCRNMRAEEGSRGTPIIVMTALDSREDMALALDAGATGHSTPVQRTSSPNLSMESKFGRGSAP